MLKRSFAWCVALIMFVVQLAYGSNLSFHNRLVDAADNGNLQTVVDTLREGENVDIQGDFGATALMRAAYKGHTHIVELLLSIGADVNIKDEGGATALHFAARAGHKDIADLLIADDAKVNEKDKFGQTPLMKASISGDDSIVETIIDNGANINMADNDGNTAFSIALNNENSEIVKKIKPTDNIIISNAKSLETPKNLLKTSLEQKEELKPTSNNPSVLQEFFAKITKNDTVKETAREEKITTNQEIKVARAIDLNKTTNIQNVKLISFEETSTKNQEKNDFKTIKTKPEVITSTSFNFTHRADLADIAFANKAEPIVIKNEKFVTAASPKQNFISNFLSKLLSEPKNHNDSLSKTAIEPKGNLMAKQNFIPISSVDVSKADTVKQQAAISIETKIAENILKTKKIMVYQTNKTSVCINYLGNNLLEFEDNFSKYKKILISFKINPNADKTDLISLPISNNQANDLARLSCLQLEEKSAEFTIRGFKLI